MVTVAGAALGALAIICASLLEELTHLAAGRPWAVSQEFELRTAHVTQEVPEKTGRKVDIWISLSPFFVGLVAMALVIVGRGVPPLSDETILFWAAWAWFTTPSLSDLKAAAGNPDHEVQTLADPELRAAWTGFTIVSVGLLLLYGHDSLGALAGLGPLFTQRVFRAGVWVTLAGPIWMFVLLETSD